MQRLSRQRCWLFLGLLSTACASPQYIARMFPCLSAKAQRLTFLAAMADVQAGPYHIYNCGTRASEASILINTLINTLEPVLEDASLPTSSTTYTTFFKNIAFAPDVYDLFLNITTGSPVSPGPHAFQGLPSEYFGIPLTPQFVCVTDYKQVTWSVAAGGYGGNQKDAYTVCQQSPVNAFGIFGSKYLRPSIVLCPAFWSFAPIPSSSKSTCLTVDPHFNRFRESGNRLVDYQLWVLLHELAHVYIYARSGSLSEVSTANDCMSLSGSSSANNAQNYVFYATSESTLATLAWIYDFESI